MRPPSYFKINLYFSWAEIIAYPPLKRKAKTNKKQKKVKHETTTAKKKREKGNIWGN